MPLLCFFFCIHVSILLDDTIDYFEKSKEEKKERVAKNEHQRLKNVARAGKVNIGPSGGVVPSIPLDYKSDVAKAATLAKASTASFGKFEQTLKNESSVKVPGVKRKFESNLGDLKDEKEKNLSVLTTLMAKVPKLDVTKAVGHHIATSERE